MTGWPDQLHDRPAGRAVRPRSRSSCNPQGPSCKLPPRERAGRAQSADMLLQTQIRKGFRIDRLIPAWPLHYRPSASSTYMERTTCNEPVRVDSFLHLTRPLASRDAAFITATPIVRRGGGTGADVALVLSTRMRGFPPTPAGLTGRRGRHPAGRAGHQPGVRHPGRIAQECPGPVIQRRGEVLRLGGHFEGSTDHERRTCRPMGPPRCRCDYRPTRRRYAHRERPLRRDLCPTGPRPPTARGCRKISAAGARCRPRIPRGSNLDGCPPRAVGRAPCRLPFLQTGTRKSILIACSRSRDCADTASVSGSISIAPPSTRPSTNSHTARPDDEDCVDPSGRRDRPQPRCARGEEDLSLATVSNPRIRRPIFVDRSTRRLIRSLPGHEKDSLDPRL